MKDFITANVIPYPPFAWLNEQTNKIEGFEVEIIQAIGEEIGISIKVQTTTWEKVFFNLLEKQCDLVAAALTITDQRLETIIFSEPYLTTGQIITVSKNSSIININDFTGRKIGVLKNTTGDFIITEKCKVTGRIRRYPSTTAAFTDLHNGEIDAIITDHPLAHYFIKNHPHFELSCIGEIFTTEKYAIAFRKESKELKDKINLGLAGIIRTGIYQKIYDKYFL